jgi:hypothetical protein
MSSFLLQKGHLALCVYACGPRNPERIMVELATLMKELSPIACVVRMIGPCNQHP